MSKIIRFTRWAVGSALLASAVGLGLFGAATASRDAGLDDDYRSEQAHDEADGSKDGDSERHDKVYAKAAAQAPTDALYQEECGSCHLAYPPGLLPSASWRAIMSGLNDHFGENAELPDGTAAQIRGFLDRNAAERGDRMTSARLLRGVKDNAPLRITDLPFFRDEHREVPRQSVENNPEIRSFSRCDACHRDAARGRFDEDAVAIPGLGRWSD